MLKLGSLFDGSGGFPLAGTLCGIEPRWAAEVEPYPIAVTRSRFPRMKHLGDVSKVNGADIEPVDVITFGSPCQDLSVAGKRAGLKHTDNGDEETTRSGLFMEAVRIIREMREATNGKYPTFVLWENVPGAFSSNGGEDFWTVLGELINLAQPDAVVPDIPRAGWAYADSWAGCGWSLAWRVFDAQYWGVPQRRRRIHLVVDFAGGRARKVLFEREGVRGHTAQSGAEGQGTAEDAENRAGADDSDGCAGRVDSGTGGGSDKSGGVGVVWPAVANTLTARHDGSPQPDKSAGAGIIATAHPANSAEGLTNRGYPSGDTAETLRAGSHGAIPMVAQIATAAGFMASQGSAAGSIGYQDERAATLKADCAGVDPTVCIKQISTMQNTGQGWWNETPVGQTLRTPCGGDSTMANLVVESLPFDSTQITSPQNGCNPQYGDPCHPLAATAHPPSVVCKTQHLFENHSQDTRYKGPLDISPMLPAQLGTGGGNNTPFVVEKAEDTVYCLQGNGIDRPEGAKCNGKNWKEGASYTLNTIDRPAVAFAQQAIGEYKPSDQASALKARDYKDATDLVCGVDCRNMTESPEVYPTLQAKPNGGQSLNYSGAARIQYIVRRLTPTECARLQGFPDEWGHPDHKDSLTDEEYAFWCEVVLTKAMIDGKVVGDVYATTGKPYKHKTPDQMLRYYNSLHTDSAEYKMWGNGIALPPALYCMQGITECLTW